MGNCEARPVGYYEQNNGEYEEIDLTSPGHRDEALAEALNLQE